MENVQRNVRDRVRVPPNEATDVSAYAGSEALHHE